MKPKLREIKLAHIFAILAGFVCFQISHWVVSRAQVVARYGSERVEQENLRIVSEKPVVRFSNGEQLSSSESFFLFLWTCAGGVLLVMVIIGVSFVLFPRATMQFFAGLSFGRRGD